eukprot:1157888-Pelagomonas_calceolata.AAC.5
MMLARGHARAADKAQGKGHGVQGPSNGFSPACRPCYCQSSTPRQQLSIRACGACLQPLRRPARKMACMCGFCGGGGTDSNEEHVVLACSH